MSYYTDVSYTVKMVKVEGEIKWGVFENANLVYTCDNREDAIDYAEIYKMLMR